MRMIALLILFVLRDVFVKRDVFVRRLLLGVSLERIRPSESTETESREVDGSKHECVSFSVSMSSAANMNGYHSAFQCHRLAEMCHLPSLA